MLGQALGAVFADTQQHADSAANLVTASYSYVNATPILSLQVFYCLLFSLFFFLCCNSAYFSASDSDELDIPQ